MAHTYFAKALTPLEQQHGADKSGVFPLIEADDAFAARMMLAAAAQQANVMAADGSHLGTLTMAAVVAQLVA